MESVAVLDWYYMGFGMIAQCFGVLRHWFVQMIRIFPVRKWPKSVNNSAEVSNRVKYSGKLLRKLKILRFSIVHGRHL